LVDLKNSGNLVGSDWRELEDGEFVTKENRVINLGLLGLKEVVKDFSEDFQKECLKCGITGGPNNGKKPGFCLTGVPEASIEKLKNLSAPPPPGITSINLNVIKINEPLSNPDAAKIVEDAKKALKQREKELKPKQASRQK
jgi:hypothetical protein